LKTLVQKECHPELDVILNSSKDGCQSFLSWFDKLTMTPITYDP